MLRFNKGGECSLVDVRKMIDEKKIAIETSFNRLVEMVDIRKKKLRIL